MNIVYTKTVVFPPTLTLKELTEYVDSLLLSFKYVVKDTAVWSFRYDSCGILTLEAKVENEG